MTWAQTIVRASLCVGLTLPGMMLLPGSFSGILSSPSPARGPEASQRMSLAIFMRAHASVLSAPLAATAASWDASAWNLLGALVKGCPVSAARRAAIRSPKSSGALRPVPTAVPPMASAREPGQRTPNARQRVVQHGHVAGELLAQRERRRVLKMRAPDLHDVRERARLGVERVPQRDNRGDEPARDLLHGGDVNRRRKDVVRGLRAVHVVVGMHRDLRAHRAAEALDGAVGDDLVGVHIRLGAAPRLPDHQREVLVEPAFDHLVGGLDDGLRLLRSEQAELAVDEGGRLLDQPEGPDHLAGEALAPDLEVVERSLGLRPPVAIRGHLDGAHAVGFLPRLHSRLPRVDDEPVGFLQFTRPQGTIAREPRGVLQAPVADPVDDGPRDRGLARAETREARPG